MRGSRTEYADAVIVSCHDPHLPRGEPLRAARRERLDTLAPLVPDNLHDKLEHLSEAWHRRETRTVQLGESPHVRRTALKSRPPSASSGKSAKTWHCCIIAGSDGSQNHFTRTVLPRASASPCHPWQQQSNAPCLRHIAIGNAIGQTPRRGRVGRDAFRRGGVPRVGHILLWGLGLCREGELVQVRGVVACLGEPRGEVLGDVVHESENFLSCCFFATGHRCGRR